MFEIPTLVDSDGSGTADIVVTLAGFPAGTTTRGLLTVDKVAAADLPVLVEAMVAPGGSPNARTTFGYDARESAPRGAPDGFSAQVTVRHDDQGRPYDVQGEVSITGVPGSLSLVGSIYEVDALRRISNRKGAQVGLEPVPSKIDASFSSGAGLTRLLLAPDVATKLSSRVDAQWGDERFVGAINVDELQTYGVALTYEQGTQTLRYEPRDPDTSSGLTRSLDLDVSHFSSGALQTHLKADLANPGTHMSIQQTATSVLFRSVPAVGLVEMAIGSRTTGTLPDDPFEPDHPGDRVDVVLGRIAAPAPPSPPGAPPGGTPIFSTSVVTARITGLAYAEVGYPDPLRVKVERSPGRGWILLTLRQGESRRANVAVQDLPGSADLSYSPSQQSIKYRGSAPIAYIGAGASDPDGLVAGKVRDAAIRVINMPTEVDLTYASLEQRLTYLGNKGIDAVIAGAADDRGLFDGKVKTAELTVKNVPASFNVEYRALQHKIVYRASSVLGEIFAVARDKDTLFDRVTLATVRARGLPPSVDLSLPAPGSITLSTEATDSNKVPGPAAGPPPGGGGPASPPAVDMVEVLLTSGPDERLAADTDGVLLRDLSDRYVLFVRVSSLQRFAYSDIRTTVGTVTLPYGAGSFDVIDHTKEATLRTAANRPNRPFRVDVLQASSTEPDGSEFAVLTLSDLPSEMTVRSTRQLWKHQSQGWEMDTGVTRLNYWGSEHLAQLVFDTDSGWRHHLHAELSPVPSWFGICMSATTNACAPAMPDGEADQGTTSLEASGAAHLKVYDCERENDFGSCDSNYRTEVDLKFRKFVVGVDRRWNGFRMFIDTDRAPVQGRIVRFSDGERQHDLDFPVMLAAEDRQSIVLCSLGCRANNTGGILCGPGTVFFLSPYDFYTEICGREPPYSRRPPDVQPKAPRP